MAHPTDKWQHWQDDRTENRRLREAYDLLATSPEAIKAIEVIFERGKYLAEMSHAEDAAGESI